MRFDEPFGGLLPGARGAVLSLLLRTGLRPTGRRVHAMLAEDYSLWTIQQALKALVDLGVVERASVGASSIYAVNDDHIWVESLRRFVDPLAVLAGVISDEVRGEPIESVIVFGSIARGEAGPGSDIDLAVITSEAWDQRGRLAERVTDRTGNSCDVLIFSCDEFSAAVRADETVASDIMRDGTVLFGEMPPGVRKTG